MHLPSAVSRRRFLATSAAATIGIAGCNTSQQSTSPEPSKTNEKMELTTLIIKAGETHVAASSSESMYGAIDWHDNGVLKLEDRAVLGITENSQ